MAIFKNIFKGKKEEGVSKRKKPAAKESRPVKKTPKKITQTLGADLGKARLAQIYGILKEPHITEKATDLTASDKYVFKVALKSNKIDIKKAVEDLYKVKVNTVNIIKITPKKRRLGRNTGWKHGLSQGAKKAVVTLAPGQKIELMPR